MVQHDGLLLLLMLVAQEVVHCIHCYSHGPGQPTAERLVRIVKNNELSPGAGNIKILNSTRTLGVSLESIL